MWHIYKHTNDQSVAFNQIPGQSDSTSHPHNKVTWYPIISGGGYNVNSSKQFWFYIILANWPEYEIKFNVTYNPSTITHTY